MFLRREVDANLNGQSTIAGLVVADSRGLCVQTQGIGQAKSAGLMTALANQASFLEPGREHPVILLEGRNFNYLVKKEDSVTVAIIKHAA
jgi:hypothetical protein